MMTRTIHGKVHGRTIELDEDLGVPEGQDVEIQVKIIGPRRRLPGLHRGGRLARKNDCRHAGNTWTEEDDPILDEIYRDRKRVSRREVPE